MPQLFAVATSWVLSGLYAIGVSTSTAIFLAPIITNIIVAASLYAVSELLTQRPKLTPEQSQQPIRQAVAPRRRYYGLVKASGVYSFLRAKDNWLYSVFMIASQRIDSVIEHWLNDVHVDDDMDINGDISTGPLALDGTIAIMKIRERLGLDTETAYQEIIDVFPDDYTDNHRGDGIYSTLFIEGALESNFSQYYPSGPYAYRAVFRAAQVWDPRDFYQDPNDPDTWEWSDNLALCVLDYLRHPDGMRLPYSLFENVIDDWSNQADICDEDVPLKSPSGDFEKRYRLSGGYEFSTDPKDVLQAMLAPADGIVVMLADGSVVLRVARCNVVEPDVVLNDQHILTYQMRRSIEKADLRNEIRAKYTDPNADFQEQESEPWVNQDSVDVNGLLSVTLDLHFCPSPSQARRIQKIYAYKLDPGWSGEITTNAYGLDSLSEQFIRVQISDLGIDEIFEKLGFEMDTINGVCKIAIRSFPQEALEWDPETEEGEAPRSVSFGPHENSPPEPVNVDATSDDVDGVLRLVVTSNALTEGGYFSRDYFGARYFAPVYFGPSEDAIDPSTRFDLTFDVDWSTDSGVTWVHFTSTFQSGATYTAYYTPAEPATTYDIRARFVSAGGLASDYVLDTIITP